MMVVVVAGSKATWDPFSRRLQKQDTISSFSSPRVSQFFLPVWSCFLVVNFRQDFRSPCSLFLSCFWRQTFSVLLWKYELWYEEKRVRAKKVQEIRGWRIEIWEKTHIHIQYTRYTHRKDNRITPSSSSSSSLQKLWSPTGRQWEEQREGRGKKF